MPDPLRTPPYFLVVPDDWDPTRQHWRTWRPQTLKEAEAERDHFAVQWPEAKPLRIVRVDTNFTEIHDNT